MLILLITTSIVFIFASFALHIIFHELGHYLFGLLTGWKLIYLQFAHCVFYSDRNRKKYSFKMVPCKGFQCIMSPIDIDCNSVGYTLGGLIANLLLSFLGLIAIFKMYYSLFLSLFFLCITVSGIALLLTNGIPKMKSLCNDMACFVLTNGSEVTSIYHNTQLIIANELMQAKTYAMMQKELFRQKDNIEINDITAYSIILNYYYHLDKDELQAAQKELIKINDYSKISNNVMCIYNLEILYLHMVMSLYGYEACINSVLSCGDKVDTYANSLLLGSDKSTSYVSSLLSRRDKNIPYTNSLLHYRERKNLFIINTSTGDVHELRVSVLYQAYIKMKENDLSGAIEALEEGIASLKSFPCIYPGEKLFCEKQLMDVCNILKY